MPTACRSAEARVVTRRGQPGRGRAKASTRYRPGSRRQKLNRARFYQPSVGRFIQEDPIELFRIDQGAYRYVLNSPARFRDPLGLVKWSCKYLMGTRNAPVIGVGGGGLGFTCSSACVNGRSLFVQLAGGAGGFSGGPFPAGLSMGTLILDDGKPIPDAQNLAGDFSYYSIGVWTGPGRGWTEISLGKATGSSTGSTWMGGFDIGFDRYWGTTWVVLQVSTPCCGSEPKE